MLAAIDDAYIAAHMCLLRQLAADAVAGPYLRPTNASTSLFSDPFRYGYAQFATIGAVFLSADHDKPDDSTKHGGEQLFLPQLRASFRCWCL